MAIVGDAYIKVHAVTDSVRDDIQRSFNSAGSVAENSGRQVREQFNRGFSRGRGGGGSSASFFSDKLMAEAARARLALQNMIAISNIVGPAIVGVVGAISSLVSGLFALSSAALSAAPSLIVLPSIFTSIAQAAITLKLAFSGVGAAFSAGLKAKGGGGGSAGRQALDNAKQIKAAADAVAQARKRLTQIIRENVQRRIEAQEQLAQANENVADAVFNASRADRDYADAQIATRKAVQELSEARKEAIEDLQQLRFESEAASLGEKKARLEFEKSRDALQRVQDLPPNSRARREAELSFAEADLNLRRAIDKNADLKKEEAAATKAGVDGSKKVIAAQDALRQARRSEEDALRGVVEAQKEVTRARNDAAKAARNIAEVERENAERQREAVDDLNDALKNLMEARKKTFAGGGGGSDAFAQAMSKLSKEAQDFVKYLLKIQPEFKKLRDSAGQELFPKLEIALQKLVDRLFPVLNPLLKATGGVLGDIAIGLANTITQASNLKRLWDVWKTGDRLLRQIGVVVEELYTSFLVLLSAASPLIDKFGSWIERLAESARISLQVKEATGQLTTMFGSAGKTAAQLGTIFKNIGGALKNMFDASVGPGSGGQLLLDTFEAATKKFKDFTGQMNADGSLKQYFLDASKNAIEVLKLLTSIAKAFLKLADDETTGLFVKNIREAGPAIQKIIDTLNSAGPSFAQLFTQVANILAAFSDIGALETFYKVLLTVGQLFESIFSNEIVAKILGYVTPILAIASALSLLTRLFAFFGKAILGSLAFMGKAILAMLGLELNVRKVQLAFLMGTGAVNKFKIALTALSVSNPWMLALTAITTALGAFWMSNQNAQAAVDDLTSAMLDNRNAMNEAAAAFYTKKLSEDITELYEWQTITELTGLTIGDLAVALAEGGEALDAVQAKIDAATIAQDRNTQSGIDNSNLLNNLSSAIENQGETRDEASKKIALQLQAEKDLAVAQEEAKKSVEELTAEFDKNIKSLTSHEKWLYNNELAAAEMEAELKALEDALDSIGKTMSGQRAQIKLRAAYRDLTAAVKENGDAILGTTAKADANKEIIIGLVEDQIARVKGLGLSPAAAAVEFGKGMEEVRKKLIKAKFKPEDVDAYLKELKATPEQAKTILSGVQTAGEKAKADFRKTGALAGQGFIDGLRARAKEAYDAGVYLGRISNSGLQAELKIESPSKVMRENGENTVLGFVLGITENSDKPAKAFETVIDKMIKGGGKKLQDFGAEIKTIYDNYIGTLGTLGQLSKDFSQGLRDALNPPEVESSPLVTGDFLKKAESALANTSAKLVDFRKKFIGPEGALSDKQIANASSRLTELSEVLKTDLISALDGARANFSQWKQDFANFKSSISSAIMGGVSFDSAYQQSLQKAEDGSTKSLTTIINEQLEKTRQFRAKLKALISANYSRDVIDQVIAQGVDGGTELAQAILDGGTELLSLDTSIQNELNALTEELAAEGYNAFFKSGTDAAEGEVKGIEAIFAREQGEDSTLNKAISALARKLARTVKLKIKLSQDKFDVVIDVKRIIREVVVPPTVVAAEGGIVNRPTYTLVGEAGPEAIIPLSKTPGNGPLPNNFGLGGDVYVTVNPSPGMDEVELAKLVSRELAFQMRKGAI